MIKQSIQSFTYYIIGAGIAFAVQIIAARSLGSTEFGKANYYYGFALTICTFASFGVQFFLPKYLHKSDNPKQLVTKSFWTITILFLILSPLIILLLSLEISTVFIILVLLLSYFMVIFGLFQSYYNGMFETQKSYLLYFGLQSLILVVFLILSFLYKTYLIYLLALMAGYFLITGCEIYRLITKKIVFDKNIVCLSFSFYLVQISYGLFTAMSRVLQKEFGSFQMVGILSVALAIGAIISMFGSVIATVVMPGFSKSWANRDHKTIMNTFYNSTRINTYFILPFAIFMLINSERILEWFGSSYTGGGIIVCLICISSFFASVTGPNGTLLNMSNNQRYEILNGILGFLGAVFMMLILAPVFFWGVAFAVAFAVIIQNCAKTIEVYRIFGFWPFKRKIFFYLGYMCLFEGVFFFLLGSIQSFLLWFVSNLGLLAVAILCNYYFSPEAYDKNIIFSIIKQLKKLIAN